MVCKKTACLQVLLGLFLTFTGTALAGNGADLIKAVMHQDLDKAKELVKSGADVNHQDETYGSTPLILSCQYELIDLAKFLIEAGADVNLQAKNGYTPLIAAAGVSEELTGLLLSKGADLNLKCANGTGAFTTSVVGVLSQRVTTDVVKKILDKGADINESAENGATEGYTVLMMAARNKSPDLVKFLVKEGADVNLKAKDGNTALSLAKKVKDEKMVTLLKKSGAK